MDGKLQAFHLFLHGYIFTPGSGEVLEVSSFTPSSGKVVSAAQPVTNKSLWGNYSGSLKQLPNPNFLISPKDPSSIVCHSFFFSLPP